MCEIFCCYVSACFGAKINVRPRKAEKFVKNLRFFQNYLLTFWMKRGSAIEFVWLGFSYVVVYEK